MEFLCSVNMKTENENSFVLVMQNGEEMVDIEHGSMENCKSKLEEIAGRKVEVINIALGDMNYSIIPEVDFDLLVKTGRSQRLE
jgi:hypothetical protein